MFLILVMPYTVSCAVTDLERIFPVKAAHDETLLPGAALLCTVLYCTVLYRVALHCTVLHCNVLHCTVIYLTAQYSTSL